MRMGYIFLVFAFVLVMSMASATNYFISDCAGLQNIQNDVSGNYSLINNIDCSDSVNWNGGAGFQPIENFSGILDGKGFIVDKLFMFRPSGLMGYGMFGYSPVPNLIQDIGLTDVNITCGQYCGAITGWNPGLLQRSFATGSIYGGYTAHVGGLVGVNQGLINNTWSNISICAYSYKTGLISDNYGTLQNSYELGDYGQYGICDYGNSEFALCFGHGGPGTTLGYSYYASDLIYNAVRSDCGGPVYKSNSAEMKKKSTYVNWDWANIWQMCDRERPPVYPSLQSFGLCCVGSWSCSQYSVCGSNRQICLGATDSNCGYYYNASLDGPLTQFDRNCSINAQSPDISITNFDLRYASNIALFGIILMLWIAFFALDFITRNYAFAGGNILLGIFLFIMTFRQIFWVFALLFPIVSITAIIFFHKGD
jgi:hypothetical protein